MIEPAVQVTTEEHSGPGCACLATALLCFFSSVIEESLHFCHDGCRVDVPHMACMWMEEEVAVHNADAAFRQRVISSQAAGLLMLIGLVLLAGLLVLTRRLLWHSVLMLTRRLMLITMLTRILCLTRMLVFRVISMCIPVILMLTETLLLLILCRILFKQSLLGLLNSSIAVRLLR